MIAQVKDNGGTKTLKQISGSTPTGNPVGTLLTTYKKLQPRNYLYCDGSTFNAGQYPALYLYLGSNVLPDYRECTMVGAEKNTTDNIATHDVYAQGQFKDDQLQNITGSFKDNSFIAATGYANDVSGAIYNSNVTNGGHSGGGGCSNSFATREFDASRVVRAGTTTHSKQKAVYVYIKAVDGVDISDEDTFLVTVKNFVEEKNSYSTTEMLTGGTWIDGKPIYRKVFKEPSLGAWTNDMTIGNIGSDFENIVNITSVGAASAGNIYVNNWLSISTRFVAGVRYSSNKGNVFVLRADSSTNTILFTVCIEYTKTTD